MSFKAIAWALRQRLPCTQKMVLMMLSDRHNSDTGQCNPSHDRLADDCGITRRSVMDQIEKLAESGYIRVLHRSKGNLKLPNQYTLLLSFGVQEVVNDVHYDVHDVHHSVVNEIPSVVKPLHQGSEPVAHKPVTEPVREPSIPKAPKKPKAPAAPASGFVIPEWVNKSHWDIWHQHPKRRKLTDDQKQLAIDKLDKWRSQGLDHAAALEASAMNNWQGLFDPAPVGQQPPRNNGAQKTGRFDAAARTIFGDPDA